MTLDAYRCENGHLHRPEHPVCPECGDAIVETIDLTQRQGTVVTWTTAAATPPGVREPNHLAIVSIEVDGESVKTLGQLMLGDTKEDIEIGTTVEPVYVEELRDPDAGIRHPDSQEWDGYRFEPVD